MATSTLPLQSARKVNWVWAIKDQRIDFVVAVVIARAGISGDGSGAQADHAHADGVGFPLSADGHAHAGVLAVVGGGQVAVGGVQKLLAMIDGAVGEGASSVEIGGRPAILHRQLAVEVAHPETDVGQGIADLQPDKYRQAQGEHDGGQRRRLPPFAEPCEARIQLEHGDDEHGAEYQAERQFVEAVEQLGATRPTMIPPRAPPAEIMR